MRVIASQLRDSVGFAPTSPARIVAVLADDDHTILIFMFWRQYSRHIQMPQVLDIWIADARAAMT